MRLRQFFILLGLLPSVAFTATNENPQTNPPVQVFRFQTRRGRPVVLFVINSLKKYWFYWASGLDLPPGGVWNEETLDFKSGWQPLEIEELNLELDLTSWLSRSVKNNFPSHERLKAYFYSKV